MESEHQAICTLHCMNNSSLHLSFMLSLTGTGDQQGSVNPDQTPRALGTCSKKAKRFIGWTHL